MQDTKQPAVKPASHDTGVPPKLAEFMLSGWRDGAPEVTPIPDVEARKARRKALSRLFPGETLVIPSGHEKVRANDTHFRFRPGSDFFWLCGNAEPDCVLVMVPSADGHTERMYVEPNVRSDIRFFTDRNRGELWTGRRLGLQGSKIRYGMDETADLATLPAFLDGLAPGAVRVLRGLDESVDVRIAKSDRDAGLAAGSSELRLIKDDAEINALQQVIDLTKAGFEDVIRGLPRMKSEREVEATFYYRARTDGNDVGYGTIAAAGANACILHWTKNDAPLRIGELLLLDAGVEGHSLYTADITRTVPIGGRFSPAQRRIYDLVYKAQRAAMDAVRPGIDFMAPNKVAMRVLAEGLAELGILKVSAEEAMKDEHQFYRRYSLHNISHMLGIDVHDCAKARAETYKFGPLQVGMVFTIEPGLYFQPDDMTVPSEYRGIGVRIEDDVVVTEDGCKNLSSEIPADADGVEAWMATLIA